MCVLDGRVLCTWRNGFHQSNRYGANDQILAEVPELNNIKDIAAEDSHCMALHRNGTVSEGIKRCV